MSTRTHCDTCHTSMGSRGFVNHIGSVRCDDLRASYNRGHYSGVINGRAKLLNEVLDTMGVKNGGPNKSAMADTGGTFASGQVRRPLTVTAILDKIVGD